MCGGGRWRRCRDAGVAVEVGKNPLPTDIESQGAMPKGDRLGWWALARRCRDAGVAVELARPAEERLCARCGSARHDTASCPARAYDEELCLPAAALAAAGARLNAEAPES